MTTPAGKPILICFDNSAGARRSIESAGEMFPGRATIVLHVWSPISLIVAAYGGVVALPAYDDDALQRGAAELAEIGAKLAIEAGLAAKPEIAEVTYEGTWHAILAVAREYDAELIVIGARGLSTFKSAVLGSVSHSVLQHAHVPVLVVPPAVLDGAAPEQAAAAAATV